MADTFISLYVHCVFSTKNRLPLILPEFRERLWAYMGSTARRHKMKALAIGGTENHAHILLSIPAILSVAQAVKLIKGSSSKWIHDTFESAGDFAWQSGYGAFSINKSLLETTIRYIESQPEHHRRVPFEDEYLSFPGKHKFDVDERYIWG